MKSYLNRYVILGILVVAALLVAAVLILIGFTTPRLSPQVGFSPADLTIIPAPTHTPLATAVPTLDPRMITPTPAPGELYIGGYAQIQGTEGEGLRIRAQPGLGGQTVFFGGESEVFLIKDGSTEVDGYIWWYLVAPYDQTRAGWAAADFLALVPAP